MLVSFFFMSVCLVNIWGCVWWWSRGEGPGQEGERKSEKNTMVIDKEEQVRNGG